MLYNCGRSKERVGIGEIERLDVGVDGLTGVGEFERGGGGGGDGCINCVTPGIIVDNTGANAGPNTGIAPAIIGNIAGGIISVGSSFGIPNCASNNSISTFRSVFKHPQQTNNLEHFDLRHFVMVYFTNIEPTNNIAP